MKKFLSLAIFAMMIALCFAISISAADFVYYENDFSDESTLADFDQCRGEWGIVDGKLTVTNLGNIAVDDHAWLLFNKDPGIMNLTDYIVEVDIYNFQTRAGIIARADLNSILRDIDDGFCGYFTFISLDGTKGAIAYTKLDGVWGQNFIVSDQLLTPGSNVHLKSTFEGNDITYVISDLETGAEIWTGTASSTLYAYGSFGLHSTLMRDGRVNFSTIGFDNLKVTAIGKVGDHLAAGKALKDFVPGVKSTAVKTDHTPAITVNVPKVVEVDASKLDASKDTYVYYSNDFSDPKTINDFTQYRGKWVIKDGVLKYESVRTGFDVTNTMGFLAYSANHNANLLKNYRYEIDVINSQSNAGLLSHADLSKISSDNNNSFYGYLGCISNNGTFFAVAISNETGSYKNLVLSDPMISQGYNIHLVSEYKDGIYTFTAYEIGKDEPLWTNETHATEWEKGTFGLRVNSAFDTFINLDTVSFDNMKVTVYGEEAILLNAGYEPNAKIVGELKVQDTPAATTAPKATDAPVATEAPDATADVDATEAPETTEAPDATADVDATEAPETTEAPVATDDVDAPVAPETTEAPDATADVDAPVAPAEEGGSSVGLIIAIVAAVVVIAAIVAVVLKKKKN